VGILHRTIFYELARVFLLSLVGITGIIVLAAIVVEASQHGLGPAQILVAIPLLVPSMLPFIIPPTTLFAACVVYGRLAHDNEIIAIKAAGVNVMHVVWPGLFLGLSMSLTTIGLYYHLIPYTHLVLRSNATTDAEEFLYSVLKKDKELRRRSDAKLTYDYEIYVDAVQGRQLKNAIFKRKDVKAGTYDIIAKAREAELKVDLENREVIVHMRQGHLLDAAGDKTRGYFDDQEWLVPLEKINERPPSPRDMTWPQLLQKRIELGEEMEKNASNIAAMAVQLSMTEHPGHLKKLLDHQQHLQRATQSRLNGVNAELYMRPAMSFGCLFFVLVGCPVGIWFSRSDYLSAFITCFMPIVFVYYPIQLCCTNLAKDGRLVPALDLWAANAVLGVLAVFLFRRLLKN
jgi:lipopolysaccharide export system permease protein